MTLLYISLKSFFFGGGGGGPGLFNGCPFLLMFTLNACMIILCFVCKIVIIIYGHIKKHLIYVSLDFN